MWMFFSFYALLYNFNEFYANSVLYTFTKIIYDFRINVKRKVMVCKKHLMVLQNNHGLNGRIMWTNIVLE